MKTCDYCNNTGFVNTDGKPIPIDAILCPNCNGQIIPVIRSLLVACKAADLALKTLHRNADLIVSTIRKVDGGMAGVAQSMFDGMKRNLSHAHSVLNMVDVAWLTD